MKRSYSFLMSSQVQSVAPSLHPSPLCQKHLCECVPRALQLKITGWSTSFLPCLGTQETLPVASGDSHHLLPYQCIPHCCCLPRSQARSGTCPLAPTTRRRGCSACEVRPKAQHWPVSGAGRSPPLLPTHQGQEECQGIGPSRAQPRDSAGRTPAQTPRPHMHPGCGKPGRGRGESGGPESSAPRSASRRRMQGLEW